jgi:hypothetical protein
MAKVSGTVYRYQTKERIPYASVKAWKKGVDTKHDITDDDGDFTFENLEKGKWNFVTFHESSFPRKLKPLEIKDENISNYDINLFRLAGTEDKSMGKWFFISLIITFVILITLYIVLHLVFPQTGFLWLQDPWRFLEILFWGLAGVLVNKIITTGWYLRSQRFYREGLVMHIAHLFTTPLLVLVAVLILSLVTLSFTLANNNTVTIDLSEPSIMIAFSFVIGTAPWPLWNFIEDTARRFTSQQEED